MMRRMIELALRNPIAMNLMMFVILGGGIGYAASIPRENFPDFSLDRVIVSVVYPAATPEEVEEGICIKIEEALDSLDGLKRIEAVAHESRGEVIVELEPGTDLDRSIKDIEQEVNAITTFPEEAEEPRVKELKLRNRVLEVALHGNIDEVALKELSREIRDEIMRLKDVSQVSVSGVRDYEISVELDQQALRAHSLNFDDVARLVASSSLNLPAGAVKTSREEFTVRIFGQRRRGEDFEQIILLTRPDGTRVRLGDVAKVHDSFAETPVLMRVSGERAAMLGVYKTKAQNALHISDRVKAYVAQKRDKLPGGINLEIWTNNSRYIAGRLSLLKRNGVMGLILVFLSLWFFLDLRLAFWVSWGIPVSFAGAMIIFGLTGQSLNLISAFGLIMALGIIVDDAIVVGENVFAHRLLGKSPLQAAIDGSAEVAVPVFASTATTVAAFLPLFMVTGMMGKFISVLPLAMISCLMVSLVEAMFILPVHLRHKSEKSCNPGFFTRTGEKVRGFMDWIFLLMLERLYRPLLLKALAYRPITVSVFAAVLLIAAGFPIAGLVGINLFPKDDSENYVARLRLLQGTPVERTRDHIERVEAAANQLNAEFMEENAGRPVVDKAIAVVGQWSGLPPAFGPNVGEVSLELKHSELRSVPSERVLARWRKLVGGVPEAVSLIYSTKELRPGGAPIEVRLLGEDFAGLRGAADELKAVLADYSGVFDIEDDFRPGKRELRIQLLPRARSLGLTLAAVGQQVRGAFYGAEAERIQRGRDDLKVQIRLARRERASMDRLQTLRIRTSTGVEVPISEVARISLADGYGVIRRQNRQRRIAITADVDESEGNARSITADLVRRVLPGICAKHGVTLSLDGQAREARESMSSLGPGFVIGLALIYCILAILFRSYTQPLIIMVAIPFGLVGVVFGHYIFGLQLTMMSMFGSVALAGIVVNDALVLVDFINRSVVDGNSYYDAVVEAGLSRFRAIILTSLTTVAGLFPLVTETDRQAMFIIPMAVTISMGLAFATLINLVLVPALYLTLVDISAAIRWLWTGRYSVEELRLERAAAH